jgi:hypothetical protein
MVALRRLEDRRDPTRRTTLREGKGLSVPGDVPGSGARSRPKSQVLRDAPAGLTHAPHKGRPAPGLDGLRRLVDLGAATPARPRLKNFPPIPACVKHTDDEKAVLGQAVDDKMGMVELQADRRIKFEPLARDIRMRGNHFEG